MGVLGSFGDVVFEVSADKIRTFDEFTRTSADRWEKHDLIGQKPKSEFVGPGLDTITFTMIFDAQHGVNPRAEMDVLLVMSRNGDVADLTIGGKGLGVAQWKITNLVQRWTVLDNAGNLIKSALDITLEEYV
jgi:phage protein U